MLVTTIYATDFHNGFSSEVLWSYIAHEFVKYFNVIILRLCANTLGLHVLSHTFSPFLVQIHYRFHGLSRNSCQQSTHYRYRPSGGKTINVPLPVDISVISADYAIPSTTIKALVKTNLAKRWASGNGNRNHVFCIHSNWLYSIIFYKRGSHA